MHSHTQTDDYYRRLEILPHATSKQIKSAYKKLTLMFHPDRAHLNNISYVDAEEKFKLISTAYEVLNDPVKRQRYDTKRSQVNMTSEKSRFFSKIIYPNNLSVEIDNIIDADNVVALEQYLSNRKYKQNLLESMYYFVCLKGKFNLARYLIEIKKIDPNQKIACSFNSGSVFKFAAESGNLNLVMYLFEKHHADIESQGVPAGCRDTALSRATQQGHIGVVKYLLSIGANPNPKISYGNILNYAIESAKLEIILLLLNAGTQYDRFHFKHAIQQGSLEIVRYFKQFMPADMTVIDASLLWSAVHSGNIHLVKYLEQEYGVGIFEPNEIYLDFKLSLACAAAGSCNLAMLHYLLLEKNFLSEYTEEGKLSEFFYALLEATSGQHVQRHLENKQKRLEIIRYLLEYPGLQFSDNQIQNLIKRTYFNYLEIISYLVSYLNAENKELLRALAFGGLKSISIPNLLHLFHINFYENYTNSSIHYFIAELALTNEQVQNYAKTDRQFQIDAIFYYSTYYNAANQEKLKILLAMGVDVNSVNAHGISLLHYALRSGGYYAIAKLLIDQGADIHARDDHNESAYEGLKHDPVFMQQLANLNKTRLQNNLTTGKRKSEMNIRKDLIKGKIPQLIPVSDKPLSQGGSIYYLTHAEFEEKFKSKYAENIETYDYHALITSEIKENITGDVSAAQLKHQLKNLLQHPRTDLVICKINDAVGYGVCTSATIPKDTVICFYAGHIIDGDKTRLLHDHGLGYWGSNIAFSTEHYRGIASFFQHAPTKTKVADPKLLIQLLKSIGQTVSEKDLKLSDELYSIEFKDKSIQAKLAIENIRHEYVIYDGIPVVLMVSTCDIPAGVQLTFNYGSDYWLSRKVVPELFDLNAEVIPTEHYRRTFYQIHLNGFTYTGDLKPLIRQLTENCQHIEFRSDDQIMRKVPANLIVNELIRVRAVTVAESKQFNQPTFAAGSLFPRTNIKFLLQKYKLPDDSQAMLEKGMRNAAANNELNDLKSFISLVKNINAHDSNPASSKTALHCAAIKGHADCYDLLLAQGADEKQIDANGELAVNYLRNRKQFML